MAVIERVHEALGLGAAQQFEGVAANQLALFGAEHFAVPFVGENREKGLFMRDFALQRVGHADGAAFVRRKQRRAFRRPRNHVVDQHAPVNEINLLTRIANQLSIAISQARLYQIVETQSNSIDKLTELCSQLSTVVNSTRELTERQESREKGRVKLSLREIEVLRCVASGMSNREISEALHITEGTTEVHVSRLRKKLNLASRSALVRYAYENHLC